MGSVSVDSEAFARLRDAVGELNCYISDQTGGGEHDPDCGFEDFDEACADYRETISDAAEILVNG